MKVRLPIALALLALAAPAFGQTRPPPLAALTVVGSPETVFTPARDACAPVDMPDAPLRAFRDARGHVVLFGMHHENRPLRGESLERIKLDCRVALSSGGNPDPAAYNDASWITATWTEDGKTVHALVHHEFQAHDKPGRCRFKTYMACWHNTVLGLTSTDGGATFPRPQTPQVVASAPFGQAVEQGRHRGFFNPSNIVPDGAFRYFLASTTGWAGQPVGVCLFRTAEPEDPASWRAWDGAAFSLRYGDPYRENVKPGPACSPVGPFPAPVGAVVRHRLTGAWLAVFMAARDGETFPEPGFYATSSRDLLSWDKPRLILAGKTLYDDPCGAERLIAYPSLLDRAAQGRNFEDVGDAAELYFTTLEVEGCTITAKRDLVRRRMILKVWP